MKAKDFNELTTQAKLMQWGKWSSLAGYHEVGYEEVDLSLRASVPIVITDDQATYIDRGIARLRSRGADGGLLARMLISYYVGNRRQSEVAEKFSISRKLIAAYLKRGEAWMDCYFDQAAYSEKLFKTG